MSYSANIFKSWQGDNSRKVKDFYGVIMGVPFWGYIFYFLNGGHNHVLRRFVHLHYAFNELAFPLAIDGTAQHQLQQVT